MGGQSAAAFHGASMACARRDEAWEMVGRCRSGTAHAMSLQPHRSPWWARRSRWRRVAGALCQCRWVPRSRAYLTAFNAELARSVLDWSMTWWGFQVCTVWHQQATKGSLGHSRGVVCRRESLMLLPVLRFLLQTWGIGNGVAPRRYLDGPTYLGRYSTAQYRGDVLPHMSGSHVRFTCQPLPGGLGDDAYAITCLTMLNKFEVDSAPVP